jgi:hypothetical protein
MWLVCSSVHYRYNQKVVGGRNLGAKRTHGRNCRKGYVHCINTNKQPTEEAGLMYGFNLLKEALENSETNAVDFVEDFKNL